MKTSERILQQACLLFNERGVADVSTLDIAADLGISIGNLYYHFANKPALLLQLCETCHQQLRPVFDLLGIGLASWKELEWQFLHLLEVLSAYQFIPQDSLQLSLINHKLQHRLQWMRQDLHSACVDMLASYVEHAVIEKNLLGPETTYQLSMTCWYGLSDHRLLTTYPTSTDDLLTQLMHLLAPLKPFLQQG